MKWIKKADKITLFLVLLFVTGIGLLIYPSLSNYWSTRRQTQVIITYTENVAHTENEVYEKLWAEAEAYNSELAENGTDWVLSEEEKMEYEQYLKTDDTGIMAYIEIPAIDCSFPIYHGTEESVLQKGIGHIEGSSLPVGGESTHCALSGHRGLPSARLFTDLDQLVCGDIFLLHTLGKTLTYEIDQISIVEPDDFSQLSIEEGMDYCTLVTCTPYGVNSHRLLVRGRRSAEEE